MVMSRAGLKAARPATGSPASAPRVVARVSTREVTTKPSELTTMEPKVHLATVLTSPRPCPRMPQTGR